ncbi:hypothetical protein Oweho_3259 [Owenweeksia hongkongensis DSM 17368]|uniref:Uncharacterized protein n=1 Tax=Owenweeksia hongkongensis (strain DSM 17368 / CIP 108786 / JCM 12287 / NRRL B-23963 / UST20020801) TaxID=926562 RepID=G8R4B0_OWEHD|nr:hypothetical protein Oweho_3259 [Owenweeksia hongkongensis DSM 17368]
MSKSFRANRRYERLVFRGTHETPESTFGRDSNGYFYDRPTGSGRSGNSLNIHDTSKLGVIARIEYDFDNQTTKLL